MVTNFIKKIAKILNYLPIIHVSEDKNFGSIINLNNNIRLSIFSIPFGENKYYLLSWVINSTTFTLKFEWHKCLNFYEICRKESQSEIDEKENSYKDLIETYQSCEKIEYQIDFLKEKANQNQDRISISYNKINNYAAINLVHIGFIGYLFTELLNI